MDDHAAHKEKAEKQDDRSARNESEGCSGDKTHQTDSNAPDTALDHCSGHGQDKTDAHDAVPQFFIHTDTALLVQGDHESRGGIYDQERDGEPSGIASLSFPFLLFL